MHASRMSRGTRRGLAALVAAAALLAALGTVFTMTRSSAAPAPAAPTTASAAVGGAKVECTSKKPGLAPELSRDIARALHGRQGAAALAVYDRDTGTTCDYQAGTAFDSASVVKVTVLGALLRQADEEHRKLTPKEVELTTAMITKSDNEATSALWRQIGEDGIKRFLSLAGMRHTVPGADGAWGLTQVTASDELKLMELLTRKNTVLSAHARGFALDLMERVAPDQRWGAPAGVPGGTTTHVKNGWLPREDNGWRVHSVGAFTGGGHDYGMAVLSQGNRTMDYGVDTVEEAAEVIHRDLAAAG